MKFSRGLVGRVCKHEPFEAHVVVGNMRDYDWYDAVLEARDHGVPIALFGNTRDKIVITPRHLGHHKFAYTWGTGQWTSESCWPEWVSEEKRIAVNRHLLHMGEVLSKFHNVYLVRVSGNEKGYLSTGYINVATQESNVRLADTDAFLHHFSDDDLVLFVFVKRDPQL